MKGPAASGQRPATSSQQPATSSQLPATSSQLPATSSQQPEEKKAPGFAWRFVIPISVPLLPRRTREARLRFLWQLTAGRWPLAY